MESKARVLFLDDEVGIVNTLRAIFRQTFEVFTSTNPAEALEIIKNNSIHVVVSDQRMPQMQGVEFLSQVRELSPNTVRILLTGYSDLTAIIGSVNAGEVFRFINKPWNHQEIKKIISTAAEIGMQTMHSSTQAFQPPQAVKINEEDIASASRGGHIMVLDDDKDLAAGIQRMFENIYEVHHAPTTKHALQLLEKHDIAVIIADQQVGGEGSIPLLKLLKQHYPLILTVMLTDLSDSELVIKLINQVQIYRFANKPIRQAALLLSVKSAMKQHELYSHRPELLVRHKVEAAPADEIETVSLKKSILSSLRALAHRFAAVGPA